MENFLSTLSWLHLKLFTLHCGLPLFVCVFNGCSNADLKIAVHQAIQSLKLYEIDSVSCPLVAFPATSQLPKRLTFAGQTRSDVNFTFSGKRGSVCRSHTQRRSRSGTDPNVYLQQLQVHLGRLPDFLWSALFSLSPLHQTFFHQCRTSCL